MRRSRDPLLTRDEILSASAPAASPDARPDADDPPVTMLDVAELQVGNVIAQCETLLATIQAMRRMAQRPRGVVPQPRDEPPATFGRTRSAPEDPEAAHG